MKIYDYDPVTQEFLGEREARRSPLDESYLIPAFATTDPPPEAETGFVVCYIDNNWTYIEDRRGETVYRTDTGEPIEINELWAIDDCFTVTPKPGPGHKWSGESWELDREAWLDVEIRPRRNQLLDEADLRYCNAERWHYMEINEKEAWRDYKQALRDLPEKIDYDDPVWPERPEEKPY